MSKQNWKSGTLYYKNRKARKFFPGRIVSIFRPIICRMELKDRRKRIGKKQVRVLLILHLAEGYFSRYKIHFLGWKQACPQVSSRHNEWQKYVMPRGHG